MKKSKLMMFRYLVAPEDSRPGVVDYWNAVYLPSKPLWQRLCLSQTKILLCIGISLWATTLISRL